jgi:hypothetical protein
VAALAARFVADGDTDGDGQIRLDELTTLLSMR